LNNTFRVGNLIVKNNLNAIYIGILLIAATFLLASNTIATAAFAQSGNSVVGCANALLLALDKLPGQTNHASTKVTLSNIGPSGDQGQGSISIPGIGSGNVKVYFNATSKFYKATVSDIPGQIGESSSIRLLDEWVCGSPGPIGGFIHIPGFRTSFILGMMSVN